jgi:hypothetical protein
MSTSLKRRLRNLLSRELPLRRLVLSLLPRKRSLKQCLLNALIRSRKPFKSAWSLLRTDMRRKILLFHHFLMRMT